MYHTTRSASESLTCVTDELTGSFLFKLVEYGLGKAGGPESSAT